MPQTSQSPARTLPTTLKGAARRQVAALCLKRAAVGTRVLLITSRDTGRWIIPKGWPIDGLKDSEAALQEAWEEAGVRAADVTDVPIGTYTYDKVLKTGDIAPVRASIFVARVAELADAYPERKQRERRWFTLTEAAKRVREPRLKQVMNQINQTLPLPNAQAQLSATSN